MTYIMTKPVGIFLGIFLVIFGGSRRLVGDKLWTCSRQVRGEVNDVTDKSAGKLRGSCRQVVSCRDGGRDGGVV